MVPGKMKEHMDRHFLESRNSKTRGWYGKVWVEEEHEKRKAKKRKSEEDVFLVNPYCKTSKSVPRCGLCQEVFEQNYLQVREKVVFY